MIAPSLEKGCVSLEQRPEKTGSYLPHMRTRLDGTTLGAEMERSPVPSSSGTLTLDFLAPRTVSDGFLLSMTVEYKIVKDGNLDWTRYLPLWKFFSISLLHEKNSSRILLNRRHSPSSTFSSPCTVAMMSWLKVLIFCQEEKHHY